MILKLKKMKLNSIRYFLSGRRIAGRLCGIALFAGIFGCTSDYYPEATASNGLLKLDAKISATSSFDVEPISDIRMLLSYRGGAYDKKFSYEIYDINRQTTSLTAQIRTGDWYLTLLSPQGAEIHTPQTGKPLAGQLMYEYKPVTVAGGNTPPAAELLLGKVALPTITTDNTTALDKVTMARNVAKVELFVDTVSNIDTKGTQTVELLDIPSQIDWEGGLLPSKEHPAILDHTVNPVVGTWKFTDLTDGGFRSDTLAFIVPAHRPADYLNSDGSLNPHPTDVATNVMSVRILIKDSKGGLVLDKTKPLPQAVNYNQVLRIKVKLSSLDFQYLHYDFSTLPDWGGTVTSGSNNLQ